jgi:streptogramin lyase
MWTFQRIRRAAQLLPVMVILLAVGREAGAEPADGFTDHGIAAPVGMSAWGGTVATIDASGKRLVFVKLWAGGDSSYLFIDAETGETEQMRPADGLSGLGAYVVFLSPDNKIYDTMNDWLLEVDVAARTVRRVAAIPGGMALSFTMDAYGTVYAGIYPSATLVSYALDSGTFTDHGPVHEEDWPQYLRPLAVDDAGWVYGGIAIKAAQVVGFNPATGERRTYIPEDERQEGAGSVFRGLDGKVYASAPGWGPYALHGGTATRVDEAAARAPHPTRSPEQFPDGAQLATMDVYNRVMLVVEPGGDTTREVPFDYDSPGVNIYTMTAAPDGTLWGSTGLPLRLWRFDPATDGIENWGLGNHRGHANQMIRQGGKLYGAVYSSGSLIELDPSRPIDDAPIRESSNPIHLHGYEYGFEGNPDMFGRPYALLAHPDGRHIVMGGNPARARVGGGMLIYDLETGDETVLLPEELVPGQGVNALAALPNGDLIVGSTTAAATGGQTGATDAVLYRIGWECRDVVERWTITPPAGAVHDLVVGGNGLVYALAAGNRFLVFDPDVGKVLHDEEVTAYGNLTGSQAPRSMAIAPDGNLYVLFRDAIARINPETFAHQEVGRPGVPISAGIAIVEDRLYFASGPRLLSLDLRAIE